jgi:hypothetical protein
VLLDQVEDAHALLDRRVHLVLLALLQFQPDDRFLVLIGAVNLAQVEPGAGAAAVVPRDARLQADRLAEAGDGLLELTLTLPRVRLAVVGVGIGV